MAAAQPRPRAWYCFSEQEEEALRQFRASLGADELRVAGDDDMTLMRFIRARKVRRAPLLRGPLHLTALPWGARRSWTSRRPSRCIARQ